MITIFTPTYNRCSLLLRLKKSLDSQTDMNFQWVIVDDGSCDGTENIIHAWLEETLNYSIIYCRQTNQGKPAAFNNGVLHATCDWFICVDSDDYLTEDAVAVMNRDIVRISSDAVGVVYPQQLSGHGNDKWRAIDGECLDIMDLKELYGIPESAILMNRKYLLEYPFPIINNEKFIPEGWLYQKLRNKGTFLVHNEAFYVSEYLDDGLTKNVWKLWSGNAVGVLETLSEKYWILKKYPMVNRVVSRTKCIINLNTICMASKVKILAKTPSRTMSILLYIPSWFFYQRRFSSH